MCRKSPFPRCDGHAKATLRHKQEKMNEASTEYTLVRSEELNRLTSLGKEASSIDDNPRVKKASRKYSKAHKEYKDAIHQNELTNTRLQEFKNEIIDIRTHLQNPKLKPHDAVKYSQENLNRIETVYKERLAERKQLIDLYDKEHHTVNGKKPSKYGTVAGVKKLKEKQAKAFESWVSGLADGVTPKELSKRASEVAKVEKTYRHAVATFLQNKERKLSAKQK